MLLSTILTRAFSMFSTLKKKMGKLGKLVFKNGQTDLKRLQK